MDKQVAMAILAAFEAARPTTKPEIDRAWKWRPGTYLFPDAICPRCHCVMHSNRIWLVDENARRLMGQVRIVGEKLVWEPPHHPHVHPDDHHICMGSAGSVVEALFTSFNMSSAYWGGDLSRASSNVRIWMADMFDHPCDGKGTAAGLAVEQVVASDYVRVPPPRPDIAEIERQMSELARVRRAEARRARARRITARTADPNAVFGIHPAPPEPADDAPIFQPTGLNVDRL